MMTFFGNSRKTLTKSTNDEGSSLGLGVFDARSLLTKSRSQLLPCLLPVTVHWSIPKVT